MSKDLDQGEYAFIFEGSNVRTPLPYEKTSNSIQLTFISQQEDQRRITLNSQYSGLRQGTNAVRPTIKCISFNDLKVGENGVVDCIITVTPQSNRLPIAAFQLDFPNGNGNEFSGILPYCDAYMVTGTPLKKQIICSRQDSTTNQASFFFTGFKLGTLSNLSFKFRIRALSASITVDLSLMLLYEDEYYTINQRTGVSLDISAGISTSSKKLFSF